VGVPVVVVAVRGSVIVRVAVAVVVVVSVIVRVLARRVAVHAHRRAILR
jgi:hypothetical protein